MSLADAGDVLLVGAGKMGMALAEGWVRGGLPGSALTLVAPRPGDAVKAFAQHHGAKLRTDLPGDVPRVIVLAVKPQVMGSVLPDVKKLVGPDTLIITVAAGIRIAAYAAALGTGRIIRVMPNTPSQIGKGISGAVAAPGVSDADRALTDDLLAGAGAVVWGANEDFIEAMTPVSGCGPAYVFYLVEAMAEAGEKQGLSPEDAMVLARQTVIGAAALLEADTSAPAQLRRNVTSPNGVTQAALEVLMGEDGLGPLMARAMDAARKRSAELGQ